MEITIIWYNSGEINKNISLGIIYNNSNYCTNELILKCLSYRFFFRWNKKPNKN